MADYINKNILCQAYIHIDSRDFTEEGLERLKRHLTEFMQSRAEFFFYSDVETDLEFREGSLKIYLTILGTIGALYHATAEYKDFREGINLLHEDAKRLSEYLISEGIFSAKVKHNKIVRLEARTGVLGSLHKISSELEMISRSGGALKADEMTKRIKKIEDEIDRLSENIKSYQDAVLVSYGLISLLDEFPRTPDDPRGKNTPESITQYRKQLLSIRKKANSLQLPG